MADCYQVPNSSSDLALRDSYWSTYDCYLLLGLRTDPFTAYLESLTPDIHIGPDETPPYHNVSFVPLLSSLFLKTN